MPPPNPGNSPLSQEKNRLTNVSWAFSELKTLRYLYLNDNRIPALPPEIFSKFCMHLRALGVAKNRLTAFPADALAHCAELAHLNLGYNREGRKEMRKKGLVLNDASE